jgi:hypothetical protein
MANMPTTKSNPLAGFMRQPKIYVQLPSQGQYWPKGTLQMTENGEFPVFSMTARDELMFKTPDALLNGQSMVDVIQSCVPNIKNAWFCPTIDLDTILIAIRLATYGERLPLTHKIPNIDEEDNHELDLRLLLEQQRHNIWVEQVAISHDLVVFVKPLTYKHLAQTSLKSFETSRLLNAVNDESTSEEQKVAMFNESLQNLTKITVDLMSDAIYKIQTGETEVTDLKFISEFVNNVDKEIFQKIQDHISSLKERNDIKPLTFTTTEEQQALGAPASYTIPVNFNNSDFFG